MTSTPDLLTPWAVGDYGSTIYRRGAMKLADSGVAPLIAFARGYATIATAAKEELSLVKRLRGSSGGRSNKQEQEILMLAGAPEGDTLALPWFAADKVVYGGHSANSSTMQYARRKASGDAPTKLNGKQVKYEMRSGDRPCIDLHPATPAEWVSEAPDIMVVEGLVKGDSALTAVLRDSGVTDSELAIIAGEDRANALSRLSALMQRVPTARRMLVISVSGVQNWRATSNEWNAVSVKGKNTFVAFDGDIRTNVDVWNAANQLFDFLTQRGSNPQLVDLGGPDLTLQEEGHAEITARLNAFVDEKGERKRLGMDDYLTRVGSWSLARDLIVDQLPEKPVGETALARRGDWRVSKDGTTVEEYVMLASDPGNGMWEHRVALGGRVLSIESARNPQENERKSGLIDEGITAEYFETTASIELTWEDQDGLMRSETITGPAEMLVTKPVDWTRKGVKLPASILRHPAFPPIQGLEWLSAIKAHRQSETQDYSGWRTMGWVPSISGSPAFIVGDQVLGETEEDENNARPCVTNRVLPGASSYGVVDTFRDVSEEEYKRQIREDIELIYHHHFVTGAIADDGIAALIVGGMFRPTTPSTDTSGAVYFYGPPGGGKSFFAGGMMSAWQSRPKTWHENRLPGQASDTQASVEIALSQVPIWVSDDLAVTGDPRRAQAQEDSMGAAIRSSYANSGKRRSANSGASLAEMHAPIALFVGTGENELTVPSVRQRAIMVSVGGSRPAFGPDRAAVDRLRDFWVNDLVTSRLCAAMIRFWLIEDCTGLRTWAERVKYATDMRIGAAERAKAELERRGVDASKASRPIHNASLFSMVFQVIFELGSWAGMDPESAAMRKFHHASGTKSAEHAIFSLAVANAKSNASSSPGQSLLQGLSSVLAKGKAHIVNPDLLGQPPFPMNYENSESLNQSLGWRFDNRGEGAWVAMGEPIGFIHERQGELMAVLHKDNSFEAARKHSENYVLGGASPGTMFRSMWDEGLCTTAYTRKDEQVTVQVTPVAPRTSEPALGKIGKEAKVERRSGVPVLLKPLLDPVLWATDREKLLEEQAIGSSSGEAPFQFLD